MPHWYKTDGTAEHFVIGANGKSRAKDLKDARKDGSGMGATGFLSLLDKPFLTKFNNDQILDAVLKNPPKGLIGISEELTNDWKKSILEESKRIGREASDLGKIIHNELETYVKGGVLSTKWLPFTKPVIELIDTEFGQTAWVAEESFYHELGFGGTIDLHSPDKQIIIDFKTKKDKAFAGKKMGYDDHMMQLGAYGAGLGFVNKEKELEHIEGKYYNLFISSETPGMLVLEKWSSEDINRGWQMFKHLVEFWKLQKEFKPLTVEV